MPVEYFPLSHLLKMTQRSGLGFEPRQCNSEVHTRPHAGSGGPQLCSKMASYHRVLFWS